MNGGGAKGFAAPEYNADKASLVLPSADVFSMGVTLLYALTGGDTLHPSTIEEYASKSGAYHAAVEHLMSKVRAPELLKSLVVQMMEPEQSRRISMTKVIHTLKRVLAINDEATDALNNGIELARSAPPVSKRST